MTNPLAQDLGGVVRLLEKATPVVWEVCERGSGDADLWFSPYEAWCDYDGRLMRGTLKISDAEAIAAAVNFLRAHSAEIAGALRDAEGWRPIESAPRDGTKVLIAGGTYSYDIYVDETYSDVTIAYWYRNHWRGDDRQAHDKWNTHNPTHWRPLPAPPTLDSAMQQGGGGGE